MSAKQPVATSEQVSLPFKNILIPEKTNYRSDLPEIVKIANSMKERGQLTPIIVTNGGSKDKPHTLVAGYRRAQAYIENGWEDREIMCVVREYKKGDVLSRIADNWTENNERVDVSAFDQAELISRLLDGTYPVSEGETPVKFDKDVVAEKLNITRNSLNKLLRVFHNITPEVARQAKKAEVPVRLLYALSSVEGDGEDKEEKEENRASKQAEVIDTYAADQAALAEQGRQRSVRSDIGKGKKKNGRGKGSAAEDYVAPVKVTKRLDDKGRNGEDYLVVLEAKMNDAKSKEDKAYFNGLYKATRFFTGKVKKFPDLKEEDFAVLEPEEEVEEE